MVAHRYVHDNPTSAVADIGGTAMDLPITWRAIGALLFFLFILSADYADAAVGRTSGWASVSPDGEAVYSIPLKLPPGTHGMTPAISLEYRSRSVHGLLGIGWNVGGLSQIARCPRTLAQDGITAPVNFTGDDRYCLDGQRLVVVNGVAYGGAGAEYRTEIETFARIRSYAGAGSAPRYFAVDAPDGRVLEFGATADSRVDGSAAVNPVNLASIWALNRIRDRSGNVIEFEYLEDSQNGVFRIAAIRYNSNPDAGVAPSHTVSFNYENRPNNEVDSAYIAGAEVRQVMRLTGIDVLYNGSILRRYEFSYEPALSGNGRSRLAAIRECGAGGGDCMAATTLAWQDGGSGFGPEISTPIATPGSTPLPADRVSMLTDINGDGRSDFVWAGGATTSAATLRYRLATADDAFGPEVNTGIACPYGIGAPFDHNGDGRGDLLMLSAARKWTVVPGNANGFTAPIETGLAPEPQLVDYRGADMNGDGLGDLVASEIPAYTGNSLVVRLWQALPGGGFSPNRITLYEQATAAGYDMPEGGNFIGLPGERIDLDGDGGEDLLMNENFTVARISASTYAIDYFEGAFQPVVVGDMNGDGCTDLFYIHHAGSLRVRVNGCTMNSAGPELAVPSTSVSGPFLVIDWNGDGRDDLLSAGATTWRVAISNGSSFAPAIDTGQAHNGVNATRSVDSNGDGLDDILYSSAGQIRIRLRNGPRADLLLSATDGFGAAATFSYRPLTDPSVYTRGSGASYPEQDMQSAAYVVSELGVSDGTGLGTVALTRFSYQGLRRQLLGRGMLGFATRTSADMTTGSGLRIEETRRQDFPYTGLPASIVVRRVSGAPVSEASLAWSALNLGSGPALRRFPYPSSTAYRSYEAGGSLDGARIATTTRAVTAIDAASGLVTDETVTITEAAGGGNAGSSSSLRMQYSSLLNDMANWCLGRPQAMQLTSSHTLAGGSAITRNFSQAWDGPKCRPTQQRLEPGDSQWQVTNSLAYDSFGNVASRSVSGIGMSARKTTLNWGGRGQLPVSAMNPLAQTTTISWDYGAGLPLSMTDPNLLTVSWAYDAFGRRTGEKRPDQTSTYWTREKCTGICDSRTRYQLRQDEKDNAGFTQGLAVIDFDLLDRAFRASMRQPGGGTTVIAADTDARGRVVREYLPFWSGNMPAAFWQFDYDILDRPIAASLRSSNGETQRTIAWRHDGLVMTRTDPLGHVTTEMRSAWGDVLRIGDAAGGVTQYDYDAFGRLLQVRDALNNSLGSISYNARGMKLAQIDMDLGNWSYTRNALGEVVAVRDAKSQVSSFTYDKLGRPTGRAAPEGMSSWTWGASATKHNIGRLAALAGPGYSESLAYDSCGRPANRTIKSDAIYRYDYAYNGFGLLDSLTYPATGIGGRLKLGYEYDSGALVRIKDANAPASSYWRLNAQDAAGNILDETLGAAIRVVSGFNPVSGVMDYRQTGVTSGNAIQDLAYSWDANDNLVGRRDLKQGLVEEFRYDVIDRLDDVRRNGVLSLDLSYDLSGNIRWKSDVCPTNAPCFDYDQARKHALIAAGGQAYGYDANGNMTNRGGASINWTSDNRPATISQPNGNSSQFWHGPAGNRWKQVASHAGTAETTIYAGELMEKVTRSGVTTWRHYVLAPSGTAAIHLRNSNGMPAATRYLARDHLGSSDKLLDASGNILVAESFGAFGARRGAGWSGMPGAQELAAIAASTRDGFTAHEHLDNLDLIHMNGRVYDPRIGRFISADPHLPDPYSGQSHNRYAYVLNNPLSLIDPSGFDEQTPCMQAPNGRCARVTVIGAQWADYMRYYGGAAGNGQVESATRRDPCGQDSNAFACRMQSVQMIPPASIVLTAGTRVDPTLSQNAAVDLLQGAAARIGNIAFNSAPVTWLFDSDMDFQWFPEPDSAAGRQGAMLGNVGLLIGGLTKSARTAINHVPAELARVVRGKRTLTTLGREGVEDVFVVAADDIAGLTASQLSQRLTIGASDVFTVIRFPAPASGVASPVFRSGVGFLEGGFTRGGAREFVIPNGPIPFGARIEVIGP